VDDDVACDVDGLHIETNIVLSKHRGKEQVTEQTYTVPNQGLSKIKKGKKGKQRIKQVT
jgi:hypothetical protein